MNIDRNGSFATTSDSKWEYIPVVGAVVGLYHFGGGVRDSYVERSLVERKVEYLESKSFSRFVILLIPVFGNLIVAIYDFQKQTHTEMLIELPEVFNLPESSEEIFARKFKRAQHNTFSLDGSRILPLLVADEGSFKQFRKVYCVGSRGSFLLAQTEYRSEDEEIDSRSRTERTQALSDLFTEKGWGREGVEIPFEFHTAQNGRIQEYANLGTPWEKWVAENITITREKKIKALQPAIIATRDLHAHNIVHRDIKPGNIIIDANSQGRLIDWDSWYDCTSQEQPEIAGTPGFLAPELIKDGEELKPIDVFAWGVTLYKSFLPETLKRTTVGLFGSEIIPQSDQLEPLDQLILDMTSQDPSKRPTMAEVAERFQAL